MPEFRKVLVLENRKIEGIKTSFISLRDTELFKKGTLSKDKRYRITIEEVLE